MCARSPVHTAPRLSRAGGIAQPVYQPYSLAFPPVFLSLLQNVQGQPLLNLTSSVCSPDAAFSNGGINKQFTSSKRGPLRHSQCIFAGGLYFPIFGPSDKPNVRGDFYLRIELRSGGYRHSTDRCRMLQEVLCTRDIILMA
jgi:hypothetical protein